MSELPLEFWETRFPEMQEKVTKLEKDVKTLTKKLSSLAAAHDAIAKKHQEELLSLRRGLCNTKINEDVKVITSATRQVTGAPFTQTEIIADAAKTKAEINRSDDPVGLQDAFRQRWLKNLRAAGAQVFVY